MVVFVFIVILAYYFGSLAKKKGKSHNKYWIIILLIWAVFSLIESAFPVSYSPGIMLPHIWRSISLYGSLVIIYLLIYKYLKKSPFLPEMEQKIDELGQNEAAND